MDSNNRIEKLKLFLKQTPNDSFLQHALALEYVKLGNDDEAEKLFNNILDREPDYTGSYYHLGKLLERKGLNDEAIAIYEKGISYCQKSNNKRAANELQSALHELLF